MATWIGCREETRGDLKDRLSRAFPSSGFSWKTIILDSVLKFASIDLHLCSFAPMLAVFEHSLEPGRVIRDYCKVIDIE